MGGRDGGGGVKIEHYCKPLIDRDWFGNKWREYKYMDLDATAAPGIYK